jgi:hypothetical protein
MGSDLGVARIRIEGDWDLEMIGEASHLYVQVYSAACFLLEPYRSPRHDRDEVPDRGPLSYPWRGGYSTVNFFRAISVQLPERYRPQVLQITYASPGFIELVGYCAAINLVVRTLTGSIDRVLATYSRIHEEIRKRGLNRQEAAESRARSKFVVTAYEELTTSVQLPDSARENLEAATGRDTWARLKILMSWCKRLDQLSQYKKYDMASFEDAEDAEDVLSQEPSSDKRRKISSKLATSLAFNERRNHPAASGNPQERGSEPDEDDK